MNSPTLITLVFLATFGSSLADVPAKKPLQSYNKLWAPSLFTKPEVITGPASPENPFKDYHLTGIAPVEDGHIITISNKKDKSKIIIEPGSESKFKVLKVERNPDVHLGTVVTLTDGVSTGDVRFEPKSVVLNTPVQQTNAPQLPPGVSIHQLQGINMQVQDSQPVTPRSRVVPPANPAQNNNQNTQQNSGQNRGYQNQNQNQTRPQRTR